MKSINQHTLLQSILLHLFPGLIVLAAILTFSNPVFARLLGVDDRLGPIVGYLLGILTGLIPVQIGILLIASKKESGKFKIKELIQFTEKSKLIDYFIYVPGMIVIFIVFFVIIAPLIQPYIVNKFFYWWPEQYNFQVILLNPSIVSDYKGTQFLAILYLLLSCLTGPFVEELYFRGFLLPRMNQFSGKWAPLLNTVLFSVYHFFSPWENLIRIAASYPLIYLVWKKRNIRFSILVHLIINTIGGIVILLTLL